MKSGARVDVKDIDGCTPLHLAATNNALEIVKYLIESGAQYDVKNNEGKTPLNVAENEDQQGPPYYQSGTVRCDEKNSSFCNIQEF